MNIYQRSEYQKLARQYREDRSCSTLMAIRSYLDEIGVKMPLPHYIFDPADKRTWRYLEQRQVDGTYENPRFIYQRVKK